ncbi:asparagine synthase (glutamine-hydrolyzing) [Coxiella-like endosymbiont]|uniref:asparagine synthase (glutamine-hydrolyzing) n=1 Tax=Coxiella-like endosymbiont TaxID=1592897 RepID=UPI00272AED58|nr:asparagine synthase (glutamine-hydrolyzing) [Coxiella-like endosymbiont]
MCGISGICNLNHFSNTNIKFHLEVMSNLLSHRGPDDVGSWCDSRYSIGLAHRRLSIIDLSASAHQPMIGRSGNVIVFNGEIYNYIELREKLSHNWTFLTYSDTEVILAAYECYSDEFLQHLRGMFAFAIWDEKRQELICARDRFGIKPFYYTIVDNIFYFASETKALLPFLSELNINVNAFSEYLTFQYTLGSDTLFENIKQLMPGEYLRISGKEIKCRKYWDVFYQIDYDHIPSYFERRLQELLSESINLHLRSDVPVGTYLSGGIDSSLVTLQANAQQGELPGLFHGRFTDYKGYDESYYAQIVADSIGQPLHIVDIKYTDFIENLTKIIYHMDFPVAGPGSFPQFMVAKKAAQHVKTLLGGQGADEIFGGYARYLIAYFEQCIKASIEGTAHLGHFVVTAESIIPNLQVLQEYKPLISEFWCKGLFENLDQRYFRLIDRSTDMQNEIIWDELDKEAVNLKFIEIFNDSSRVGKKAYFDKMTRFDFKCLLPALLHIEDRMSMAHSLESRVPFLDHPLVEFVATIPADIKFPGGKMKHLLKNTYKNVLPEILLNRHDKMGFPVPLKEWFSNELKGFLLDTFSTIKVKNRPFFNYKNVWDTIQNQQRKFSRKVWGLLSLEIWYQTFFDRHIEYKKMLNNKSVFK